MIRTITVSSLVYRMRHASSSEQPVPHTLPQTLDNPELHYKGPASIDIVGAGLSGLTMAERLSCVPDVKIRVIEARPDFGAEKIWSTWIMPRTQRDRFIRQAEIGQWRDWRIDNFEHESKKHPYIAVRSKGYLKAIANELETRPNVKLQFGQAFEASQAELVLDSRAAAVPDNALKQHFLGWQIKFDQPVFEPGQAVLMDFIDGTPSPCTFIYILPFSETTALVELTCFSQELWDKEAYKPILVQEIERRFGTGFRILQEEQAVLPMATVRNRDKPGHLHIGQPGGWMRPSSSYSFGKSLQMADKLAPRIIQGHDLANYKAYPWHLRMMDKVFLSVLSRHPEKAPDLFRALGKGVTGGRFARFMVGEPNLNDIRNIMTALPKGLFLSAVARGGFL